MSLFRPGALLRRLRSALTGRDPERELRDLEARAESASASFQAHYYLRAAELAASMGRRDEALGYYGRAIDGHLEAGRGRAAEALCRKVVTTYPEVVRARRTMALLAIGRGDQEEGAALIGEYVAAARAAGDPEVLHQSLRVMALLAEEGPARDRAAAELRTAGVELAAPGPGSAVFSEDGPLDSAAGPWSQAMRAALLHAENVRDLPLRGRSNRGG